MKIRELLIDNLNRTNLLGVEIFLESISAVYAQAADGFIKRIKSESEELNEQSIENVVAILNGIDFFRGIYFTTSYQPFIEWFLDQDEPTDEEIDSDDNIAWNSYTWIVKKHNEFVMTREASE